MDIVIPTRGRWDKILTCDRLPESLWKRTYIVCPEKERDRHTARKLSGMEIIVQPDDNMTIAAKRAWIMREWPHSDRILMMDDDLTFHIKREEDATKLRPAQHDDILFHVKRIQGVLGKKIPHAGFSCRLFNNAKPHGSLQNKRMQYVLGYYLPTVREHCDLTGRIETREDMDYALQLLKKGFPNDLCYDIAVEQSNKYAAVGGCSGQRTLASSDADAERLHELHPGHVRVVEKNYKGNPRKEVVCRWEAALRDGQKRQ